MKRILKAQFIPLLLALLLVIALVVPAMPVAAQSTVNLRTAESFAILAASAITVAGAAESTTIYGDIGVYPNNAYTGEGNVVQTGGDVYLADASGVAQQAQDDLLIAYDDAAGRESTIDITGEDLGNLGTESEPLLPGVYTASSSLGLTGTLYLYADNPNDAFIFQIGSTLTTAAASEIVLLGEATFCQVYWQVGSSATLGSNSLFVGHILAYTDISVGTGAEVIGQLLALGGGGVGGAVTLDGSNTITNELCLPTGSLRVTKDVQGSVDDMTIGNDKFTIIISDGVDYNESFDLADGESADIPGEGTYRIEETDWPEGYELFGYSINGGDIIEADYIEDVVVDNGANVAVTVINNTVTTPSTTTTGGGGGTVTATPQSRVGISIDKSVSPVFGTVGDVVTYNFVVENSGEEDLEDVVVEDATLGETWIIGDLAEGEEVVLTYQFTIGADVVFPFMNTVTVTGEYDGITVSASDSTTLVAGTVAGEFVEETVVEVPVTEVPIAEVLVVEGDEDDRNLPMTGGSVLFPVMLGLGITAAGYWMRRRR